MSKKPTETIDLDSQQSEALLDRVRHTMNEDDAELIRRVFESYSYVADLVEDKNTTIKRLRNLFFGSRSEKTKDVVGDSDDSEPDSNAGGGDASDTSDATSSDDTTSNDVSSSQPHDEPSIDDAADDTQGTNDSRQPGHGRHGADDYRGGDQVEVPHDSLAEGDTCPDCEKGTLNENPPGVFVRIVGRAPLHATVFRTQKLRCNLCGKIFTAALPEEAGDRKYDETAASMIALLKYGSGLPFNRLQRLQRMCDIPLPASTQWNVLSTVVPFFAPVYEELIRQAAQGDVVYNDDTTVKILELMGERARQNALNEEASHEDAGSQPARTGLYTSGVVSTRADSDGAQYRIALFFSGRQHAGENLASVLRHRAEELAPPIQMCDALSRNLPKELETIVANCLAHARRNFVELNDRFEEECRYLLESLSVVYANEQHTRDNNLSPEDRLAYHQLHSQAVMDDLHAWLERQFVEKLVEPNSQLGIAMNYMLKRWEKFTVFLRQERAPLDNNLCERALKKAIQHRKNSLFYRTENGARVGDMFMSLIYTCELNGINAFDYLNSIQRNAPASQSDPTNWLPWNYSRKPPPQAA